MSALPMAILLLALGPSEGPVSELLRLPLEQYPPELRARVTESLARAEREPEAATVGALGKLLHAYDQMEPAALCYRRARALAPATFEWAYLEGVVRAALGEHAAAVEAFKDAVRAEPGSLPARLKLGEALFATGDFEGSAAQYRATLASHPRAPQVPYGLGRIEAARGRLAAAAALYLEATRLFEPFGAAQYALALACRDLGREEDARLYLALYQKHWLEAPPLEDPVLDEVRRQKGGALPHLAEGIRLGQAGDTQGSIREHEKALEEDPTLVQAHANLVSLYGRLQQWEKAEQHYRAAAALGPGLADLHYDYGVVLTQQGRSSEAADAFRKAIAINPYHAKAHNNLGALLLAQGRLEDAAVQFRATIENDPGNRLARFNLGRVLVAQGRLDEAIEQFQRIVTPDDEEAPRYLYALGAAYVRAGDREKGVRYAHEAKRRAEALGQAELAASIEKDLARLSPGPRP